MKKMRNIVPLIALCLITVGCSSLKFPGVYKLTVQQGNYIEQEMIDQLETGMTKDQVRYVMGTPLVEDTFNTDRWDYFFNVRLGDETTREYHFTVHFDEQDQLASWEGDYEPSKKTKAENEDEALEQTKKEDDAKFKKNDERRF